MEVSNVSMQQTVAPMLSELIGELKYQAVGSFIGCARTVP